MEKKDKSSIKIKVLGMMMMVCLCACRKQEAAEEHGKLKVDKLAFSPMAEPGDIGNDIMCTNNSNNRLEVFNYGDANWNDAGSLRWSWEPSADLGYSSAETDLWNNGDPEGDPMDAKRILTSVWSDCSEVMVTVGGQLATIAKYTTTGTKGYKLWAINCGAGSYPHAAELIPNGNVAVAAAHGDWVRVYNTTGTNYANYPLVGAHGVVWDYELHRLWVVGDTKITALIIGGTRTAPTIQEDTERTRSFPGNGHDLSRFEGDGNKLWVTNSNSVFTYNKTTKTFTNIPGAAYRNMVKAASNNNAASGYMIVETRPNTADCTLNTWCTPSVDFYNSSGTFLASRTRTAAAFYKGDVWWHDDQPAPAAPVANGKYAILSLLNGKAAAVSGASTGSGAKITMWPYTPTNPNDEWNITKIGSSGYYRITNVNSGRDMALEVASYDNAVDIVQYTYEEHSPNHDEWKITAVGGGAYKIESRYSGQALNVAAAATADGTQVIQWPYSDDPQRKWTLSLIP